MAKNNKKVEKVLVNVRISKKMLKKFDKLVGGDSAYPTRTALLLSLMQKAIDKSKRS